METVWDKEWGQQKKEGRHEKVLGSGAEDSASHACKWAVVK